MGRVEMLETAAKPRLRASADALCHPRITRYGTLGTARRRTMGFSNPGIGLWSGSGVLQH